MQSRKLTIKMLLLLGFYLFKKNIHLPNCLVLIVETGWISRRLSTINGGCRPNTWEIPWSLAISMEVPPMSRSVASSLPGCQHSKPTKKSIKENEDALICMHVQPQCSARDPSTLSRSKSLKGRRDGSEERWQSCVIGLITQELLARIKELWAKGTSLSRSWWRIYLIASSTCLDWPNEDIAAQYEAYFEKHGEASW
jgi:hypothetical protein